MGGSCSSLGAHAALDPSDPAAAAHGGVSGGGAPLHVPQAPQPPQLPQLPAPAAASAPKAGAHAPNLRRESEKKGLRAGLVHSRPGAAVFDLYEKLSVIGTGMTGRVYLVRSKATQELFALKSMDKTRIDAELLSDLRNEIEILRCMDHPVIVRLIEFFEDESNLYLILEHCDGGELFERLHDQAGQHYSEAEAARLVFKMTAALAYIHYMGVTHRDLKLENFVFETKAADSGIKLIDFGLSSKYGSTQSMGRMNTLVGTPYYIAPEVLDVNAEAADGGGGGGGGAGGGGAAGGRGYTNSCDCWSLGVISYMLLSGSPPFRGRRDREVLQAVRRGKYTLSGPKWEGVSEDAKDFIRRLLVYNPARRMTAEAALRHPWLQRAKHDTESRPLDPEILLTLRDFSKMTAFKRAAMEAIAFSMSTQSTLHYQEAFAKVDKTQSGFVSERDFVEVMQAAGMERAEAERVFVKIDTDGSNSISYTEFLSATLPRRFWLSRARVRDAFARFDVDNTGYITPQNLRLVLGDDWTPELAHQLFDEIGAVVKGGQKAGRGVLVDALAEWFVSESEFAGRNGASSGSGTGSGSGSAGDRQRLLPEPEGAGVADGNAFEPAIAPAAAAAVTPP